MVPSLFPRGTEARNRAKRRCVRRQGRYVSPGNRFRGDEARRATGLWSPSTVRDIVRQTAYSGVHRVRIEGDGVIERPVPAIVAAGLRERAEVQLAKNRSRTGELRKNGRKYLLTGLVRREI